MKMLSNLLKVTQDQKGKSGTESPNVHIPSCVRCIILNKYCVLSQLFIYR